MAQRKDTSCAMNAIELFPETVFIPSSDENASSAERELREGILRELLENGLARPSEQGIELTYEQAANLYGETSHSAADGCGVSVREMMMLGFPEPYPFALRVETEGDFHDADFRFKWGFYVHYHGEKLDLKRQGCFLLEQNKLRYALSLNLYKLCERLDRFNRPDGTKNHAMVLRELREIKFLASQGGVELEALLSDTIVDVPEKLGIRMEKNEQGLRIAPDLPTLDVDRDRFAREVGSGHKIRDMYVEDLPGGSVRRVVFSEKQKEQLVKIKKHARVPSKDVQDFIAHPEEYFDPDLVDLDSFSERVKEIGFYKPRYYPFVTPYKSEWFEGLLVEESTGERRKILVRNREQQEALVEAIRSAEIRQEDRVVVDDATGAGTVEISLEQARKLAARSEKQLCAAPGRVREPRSGIDGESRGEKVLIIYENVEELEFTENVAGSGALEHRCEMPPNLAPDMSLLPHQLEGIAWLQQIVRLHEGSSPGGLLADDMGLGKTLQILAFLEWHDVCRNRERKPYLVVAPVALLESWEAEYRRFFPNGSLDVHALYGGVGDDSVFRERGEKHLPSPLGLYLTTYETLRRRQRVFCAVDWAVVVLDEAQKIKTPGTLVTNAAKALKADLRIAATGTPVENTLVDLWCITDFIMPGLLGSAKEFNKQYKSASMSSECDVHVLGERIRGRFGCFFKRRMKKDILTGLPPKHVSKHPRPMPTYQDTVYREAVERLSEARRLAESPRNLVLSTLHLLRDISDHPYLAEKNDTVFENFPCSDLVATSAKLVTTVELLREIRRSGEKVILFALRRPVQQLLRRVLVEEFALPPGNVSIVNGSTPVSAAAVLHSEMSRQRAIDDFQSRPGFQAIIISPLAAGFGLNIAGGQPRHPLLAALEPRQGSSGDRPGLPDWSEKRRLRLLPSGGRAGIPFLRRDSR